MSSPNLNNVILLGGIMMYSTVFIYGLDGRLSPLSYNYACRVSIVELSTVDKLLLSFQSVDRAVA